MTPSGAASSVVGGHRLTLPLFAGLYLVFLFSFFPGILSYDCFTQLREVLEGRVNDWHSPVMAWLWIRFNRLHPGPAPWLVLDLTVAFVALFLLLRGFFATWRGAFLALALLVFVPANLIVLGTISKEGVFCPAMLFALALAFVACRTPQLRLPASLGAAFALAFAVSIRPEGFAAAFPIFAWLLWPALAPHLRPRFLRLGAVAACATLAALACFFGAGRLNRALTHGIASHPEQVILYHDLAALSVATDELLIPPAYRTPAASLDLLRATYDPGDCIPLVWGDRASAKFLRGTDDLAGLRAAWRRAVLAHPGAYLRHRLKISVLFLGFGREPWSYELSFWPFEEPAEFYRANDAHFTPSFLSRVAEHLYRPLHRLYLFRPYVFILLGCGVLAAGRRFDRHQPRTQLILAATASGLCHAAIFTAAAPAPSMRYAHWLVFSTTLAAILAASLLLGNRRVIAASS